MKDMFQEPVDAFQQRLDTVINVLSEKYFSLYGTDEEHFNNLINIMKKAYYNRKEDLWNLDTIRLEKPDWYLSENVVGITLYVDLFSESINKLKEKVSYLKELGVNYIHFLPLLKTRENENDGGYAVSSYTEIESKLGSMVEFEALLDLLRLENISTCLDFILNHTAKEHKWALRAMEGDKKYQDMYLMYDSDEIPNEFEKNLYEVFPDIAPKNFTYYNKIKKWVFTTFYEYQWDLNYQNPYLLNSIVENLLFLVNRGIDVIRLDAIRHIWKEVGTDCSGLPQVHTIVSILKIIIHVVSPGVIFKGEAITSTDSILEYFGTKYSGCQVMYNVSLMVCLWNSLATRDIRYMKTCLENNVKAPEGGCWINYVRCHDDVVWIFEEDFLRELGIDPILHKQFLNNFYTGNFPGSFARGELYGVNEKTKDARITGTLASLCGLEKALDENNLEDVDLACRRILLLHSIILSYEGIPIIYSGDEIAAINDYSYKNDPQKKVDSRWLHRTKMNWSKASNRVYSNTIEGRVFQQLNKLIYIRKQYPVFSSNIHTEVFDTGNKSVIGYFKKNHSNSLLTIANFSEYSQEVETSLIKDIGFYGEMVNIANTEQINLTCEKIQLEPYEFMWLMNC